MNPTIQVALVAAILFLSSFVRSAVGFGDALLAMPLLTLVLEVQQASPLAALVGSTIALTILLQDWRSIDLQASWRLIVASMPGIPVGLLLLKTAPESVVKAILGVLLVGFGLYQVAGPRLPPLQRRGLAFPFGFAAGILGGAYNTSGPPVIIYGALRQWSGERFRATLQGYFLLTGLLILIGHGLSGLWTTAVLRQYLIVLPIVLLAIGIGGRVNRRLPGERFHRIVYLCLIAIGLFLVFSCLFL